MDPTTATVCAPAPALPAVTDARGFRAGGGGGGAGACSHPTPPPPPPPAEGGSEGSAAPVSEERAGGCIVCDRPSTGAAADIPRG